MMQNLNTAISKINVLLPPVEYIKSILGVICDSLGYSFASVIEIDDAGEGKMLVAYNLPEEYIEKVNTVAEPILSSPSGEALETGRIVVVTNPYSESRLRPWHELMQKYSIQTEVWVPLFRMGKGFGVYVLYDTKKRILSDEELAILEPIGVIVSIAITSNRYLSELSTEIEERKVAEEELQQMRDGLEIQVESRTAELSKANIKLQLFKNQIDQSNDAIYIIEPATGCFLDLNEKACLNFGCKREDMLGKKVMDIVHTLSDVSMWAQHVEEVKEKGHLTFESMCKYKDDTTFPVEINVKYINIESDEYMVSVVRDITERKQAESEINDVKNYLETIIRASSDVIGVLDADGKFEFINDACAEIIGWSKDEIIGKSFMMVIPSDYHDFMHKRWAEIQNGVENPYETVVIGKDGTRKNILISHTSMEIKGERKYCIIGKDITERKKAEEERIAAYLTHANDIVEKEQIKNALIESEKQYQILFNSAGDAIFIHNLSGRFIEVNNAACELLGYTHNELLRMTPMDIDSNECASQVAQNVEILKRDGCITFESVHVAKDGTLIPVESHSCMIEYTGQPCILSITRNITERKRMELALKQSYAKLEMMVEEKTSELQQTNRELSNANAKLIDVDRIKSEFLDTISHELRTPLTSIIGYSSLLLDGIQGKLNEKQTKYADGIWRKGNQQLQLVNDLLDLSKLESSRMTVNLGPVSVSETITDIMSDVLPLLKDKQHETAIEIADGVGYVCADGIRLKQVLLNLVSNAIKFTPNAGRIIIKADTIGEMVRISVIDNGIGLREEEVKKLFKRFIQIDQSNTRSIGGTGLGLAIVKDLMELMNGSVELESEFGKGATFSILLPKTTSENPLVDSPKNDKQTMFRF